MQANSQTPATYKVEPFVDPSHEAIIEAALDILDKRMRRPGAALNDPTAVRNCLRLRLSELEHEVFVILFLDTQNCLIAYEEVFRGTVNQTSVYPREVVKLALARNASAVIVAHNHPSGVPEPSSADRSLTDQLKNALGMVDVKVLDHMIVAGADIVSFAERGWI